MTAEPPTGTVPTLHENCLPPGMSTVASQSTDEPPPLNVNDGVSIVYFDGSTLVNRESRTTTFRGRPGPGLLIRTVQVNCCPAWAGDRSGLHALIWLRSAESSPTTGTLAVLKNNSNWFDGAATRAPGPGARFVTAAAS